MQRFAKFKKKSVVWAQSHLRFSKISKTLSLAIRLREMNVKAIPKTAFKT